MDAFGAIMLGGGVLVLVALILLGLFYPGTGADQIGWQSPREHEETEKARDADDLAQMLEAANSRRRARGERELTVRELRSGELRRDL